jgi:putative transcriptional regulator
MVRFNRKRIRVLLIERDIPSQRKLSDLAGIGFPHISRLLSAHPPKSVRFSTLDALCNALSCTPGDLLEYVDEGAS